jgi:hypothetical protein
VPLEATTHQRRESENYNKQGCHSFAFRRMRAIRLPSMGEAITCSNYINKQAKFWIFWRETEF